MLNKHVITTSHDEFITRVETLLKTITVHGSTEAQEAQAILSLANLLKRKKRGLIMFERMGHTLGSVPTARDNAPLLAICKKGTFENSAFALNPDFQWSLERDEKGGVFLVPREPQKDGGHLLDPTEGGNHE